MLRVYLRGAYLLTCVCVFVLWIQRRAWQFWEYVVADHMDLRLLHRSVHKGELLSLVFFSFCLCVYTVFISLRAEFVWHAYVR